MPSSSGPKSPSSERREPSNLVDINAQLYAQGITKANLKLDGLSSKHKDNVIRILQGLLQKRTEDLGRTEAITTAHRVLSYDHERLCGMHKKLKTRVIVAEKEKEATKAQMSDVTTKLQREQTAHKLTKDEAQKARNALAFVRVQAQHDSKKRDTQLERTMQQWQKLSNENARVSTAASRGGMLLLNPLDPVQQIPRADSFWDPAINELNQSIISFQEECEAFRHVTLSTANQLQTILAIANGSPEPIRLTPSAFFSTQQSLNASQLSSSTSHPLSADNRLRDLLSKLKNKVESEVNEKRETATLYQSELNLETLEGERVERVKELMKSRMQDLERQLSDSRDAAKEAQELLLEYAKADGKPLPELKQITSKLADVELEDKVMEEPDAKVEAVSDEERAELEIEKEVVEAEKKRMTAGLVRLAQERAVFEAERAAYLEDKRARELEELLREPSRRSVGSTSTSSAEASASEASATRSSSASAVPSTPPRRSASLSSESTEDATNRYPPTSAHRILTPTRPAHLLKAVPSISSPLAGGSRMDASPSKNASPALRKRARKGPATPLARYVSHKIVAEKLASAKKARKLKFDAEEVVEEDGDEDQVFGSAPPPRSSTAEPAFSLENEPISPKPIQPTQRLPALGNSTKDNAPARTRPTVLPAKDRLATIKAAATRTRVTSPSKAPRPTPAARGYMSATSSSGHKEGLLKSVPVARKLEIGQASGMGPAMARKKAGVR